MRSSQRGRTHCARGTTPLKLAAYPNKKSPPVMRRGPEPASLVQIQPASLAISFTLITVAAPAQATQFIFALQLRGPFSAGLRARLSAYPALCTAVSAPTLPRHSLLIISPIIRPSPHLSIPRRAAFPLPQIPVRGIWGRREGAGQTGQRIRNGLADVGWLR